MGRYRNKQYPKPKNIKCSKERANNGTSFPYLHGVPIITSLSRGVTKLLHRSLLVIVSKSTFEVQGIK